MKIGIHNIWIVILISTLQFMLLRGLLHAENLTIKRSENLLVYSMKDEADIDVIDWRKSLGWHNDGALRDHTPINNIPSVTKKLKNVSDILFVHSFETKKGFKSHHRKVLAISILLIFMVINAGLTFLIISGNRNRVDEQSLDRGGILPGRDVVYELWTENSQMEWRNEDPLFVLFKKILQYLCDTGLYRTQGITENELATELNNYPRYIRAAVKTYSLGSFNQFLTILRVYKTIQFLEKNDWLIDDEDELLFISGFSDMHELHKHVPEYMQHKT